MRSVRKGSPGRGGLDACKRCCGNICTPPKESTVGPTYQATSSSGGRAFQSNSSTNIAAVYLQIMGIDAGRGFVGLRGWVCIGIVI